jgi:hypothetical protein
MNDEKRMIVRRAKMKRKRDTRCGLEKDEREFEHDLLSLSVMEARCQHCVVMFEKAESGREIDDSYQPIHRTEVSY